MILDTCYAAKGSSNIGGPTKGANEVIAATNEVIEAPGVSRLSFTRVLVRVLKNFAEKHRTENLQLSAVWLCTHMRNYYYDQELKKPPYYVSLVNYRFDSCRIVPRPNSRNPFLGGLSPLMPPDLGPFRVTVAIHLKESPSGDMVSWLQGQGAPAGYIEGVELIRIQAAYLANSSMLLVTLPPAVWLLLPPDIPCTFLGLTCSGNLLAKEIGSSTVVIRTEKTLPSSIERILVSDPPPPADEEAILLSRDVFDLQLRRQNQYWIDRVSGNVRFLASLNRYKYRRLGPREFRLIKLPPGQEKDHLIGSLITVKLGSAPKYVALSYVWGPPCEEGQDPPIILLDDFRFELMPNLHSAMRALRRIDEDTHIWIDALCINQYDSKERISQIPLIVEVYRLSDSVAVWLGETTSYGKVAFSFATWIIKHPDLIVYIAEQQLRVLITAFLDMIRNPWFQRKWVITDFVFAKEVNIHYGKDVLPWKTMAGAVYVLRYRALDLLQLFLHEGNDADSLLDFLADFKYQGVNDFVDLRDDMQRDLANPLRIDPRVSLDELVTRTALLNTASPHDVIYSMEVLMCEKMSLSRYLEEQSPTFAASESENFLYPRAKMTWPSFSDLHSLRRRLRPFDLNPLGHGITPNYGLPARGACSDFVKDTIRSTRQLDIICRPWAPEVSNLPSWVRPRSEHAFKVLDDNRYGRENADGLAVRTSTNQTLYSASGMDVLHDSNQIWGLLDYEEPVLIVEGLKLGIVNMVARPAYRGILPMAWRELGELSNNGRLSEDWFWRTLVADRDPTGLACPAWYKPASEQVLQNSNELELDIRRLMFESSPGMIFDFLERVQSVIWGRRLVTLGEGYVVLGPGSCRAEDVVCILRGCSVPVLLRRRSYADVYEFVGECYVHGMMDGEVKVLEKQKKLHTRSFRLY